jgi:tyrosinase
MWRGVFFTGLVLGAVLFASGQGIRKNYTEMTAAEKGAYVDALFVLHNDENWSQDVVRDIAEVHGYWSIFPVIHFPQEETNNQFVPWHRMVLWEVEDAIQRHNPRLTVPYWDWRVNRDTTDVLFQSFLSLENSPWPIERYLGQSSDPLAELADSASVDSIQSITPFWEDKVYPEVTHGGYTNAVEQRFMHAGPHFWVGGTMESPYSPLEPIFFLHHAMIDKMWELWERENPGVSSFSLTALYRYDGETPSPHHDPLPEVDPNDITDGRVSMGTFYSDGGVAKLDGGYEVANIHRNQEYFVYPGVIEAGDFSVPLGKSAAIHSNSQIVLKSGFVSRGSLVLRVGGYDGNFPLAKAAVRGKPVPKPKAETLSEGFFSVKRAAGRVDVAFQTQDAIRVIAEVYDPRGVKLGAYSGNHLAGAGKQVIQVPVRADYRGIVYLRLQVGKKIYRRAVSWL